MSRTASMQQTIMAYCYGKGLFIYLFLIIDLLTFIIFLKMKNY